jgi:hypothetical protein
MPPYILHFSLALFPGHKRNISFISLIYLPVVLNNIFTVPAVLSAQTITRSYGWETKRFGGARDADKHARAQRVK